MTIPTTQKREKGPMAGQVASPEDGFYSPKGSDLGKTNKTLLMPNLHASFYFTIIRLHYLFLHFFLRRTFFRFISLSPRVCGSCCLICSLALICFMFQPKIKTAL